MKRFPHSVCLALAVLTLPGISRPVLAEERPFQLQKGGVFVRFDSYSGADVFAFGEITHLGKTYVSGRVGVNPTGPDTFDAFGSVVFIAANGDRLYATVEGAGGISMFTGDVSSADFTLTFVGGTGRFADASGSADLIFLYDPLSGAYFRSIEGTIDY